MTIPTETELAQAYQQGYQDGRRSLASILRWTTDICDELLRDGDAEERAHINEARAALAKVAQPQPATKGE